MTDGFSVEDGKIVITKGARTVATTDGTLINALTSPVFDDTITVNFPDPPKGRAGFWSFSSSYNFIDEAYGWGSTGQTHFTRLPQEWAQTSVIGSVPTGADLFWARIRINRTTAPSHTWLTQTIAVRPKENVWLPFSGSVIVEATYGMVRAFSIYIDGSDLVLHRQQTIGPKTRGYGAAGDTTVQFQQSSSWAEMYGHGSEGMAVCISTSSPYRKVSSGVKIGEFNAPSSECFRHKWNGSDPPSQTDPTDYESEYSVDVYGQFARRS